MLRELSSFTTLLESIVRPTIIGGNFAAFILFAFFVILTVLESKAPKRKLFQKE